MPEDVQRNGRGIDEIFVEQLQDWLRAIRKREDPYCTGLDGRNSVALIERCYKERKQLELPWMTV